MKNNHSAEADVLIIEATRYQERARDKAMCALHKSPDGRTITELDARLIRDDEIRAETYASAAALLFSLAS